MKNKSFKAHVMHTCKPRNKTRSEEDPEVIEVTLDMPFVPTVGMMIRTTVTGDFLKVAGVFWDCDDPAEMLIFTEPPEPELLRSFASMRHEGWRSKAMPSGVPPPPGKKKK